MYSAVRPVRHFVADGGRDRCQYFMPTLSIRFIVRIFFLSSLANVADMRDNNEVQLAYSARVRAAVRTYSHVRRD